MRNGKLGAVVFDFDGTLAEPAIDFAAMKREVSLLVRGFVPGASCAADVPVLEWLEVVAADLAERDEGLAKALLEAADRRIREVEAEAAKHSGLFPFTRDVLAWFSGRGVATAIITRNCSEALYAVFPDAAEVVGAVLTRDDVRRVKPDPEHITEALAVLGVEPVQALMVGDHPLDVETGHRAGTLSAGVLTGSSDRKTLLEAGADFVVKDCSLLWGMLAASGLVP